MSSLPELHDQPSLYDQHSPRFYISTNKSMPTLKQHQPNNKMPIATIHINIFAVYS